MYKTIVEHYWIPTWTLNRLLLGYVKILFWIATFDNSPSWLIQIVIKVNHCLQSSTFLRVFPSAGCWERTRLTEMYCRLIGLKCCGVVICAEEELNGFMCTTRKDCQDADGSFDFGFVIHLWIQFSLSFCLSFNYAEMWAAPVPVTIHAMSDVALSRE